MCVHLCRYVFLSCTLCYQLLMLSNRILLYQSMIGHCLRAAGGLEAMAMVKAITTGWQTSLKSNAKLLVTDLCFGRTVLGSWQGSV
ncbi:hypothetical protein BT93_F2511 [Corymbia citriodora subsp. variegata]|nr:hypothetical protein BT93_F2511 [Corymbia citriodora subsp. variegata]